MLQSQYVVKCMLTDGFVHRALEIQCHTLPISFISLLITISRKSNSKKKKFKGSHPIAIQEYSL